MRGLKKKKKKKKRQSDEKKIPNILIGEKIDSEKIKH